jgi:hypothetical protein
MAKIYVLSSSDLTNHSVIFETKEVVNLSQIKKIVGFENLEIEYEADFTGFPISEYKGYFGFDESTNDLLSINHPGPYIGYINSNFSEYKTTISSYIFKISTEEASLKIAKDYHNNYSVSKKLSRKINSLIKKKNEEQNDWHEWLSLLKEKGRNEVKKLDDKFWKNFTAESEVKIREFYENNPYIKLKKPTGLRGFFMKIKSENDKESSWLGDENWKNHVEKCQDFIKNLIPDDEKLSEIKLPCLFCKTDNLLYQPKFYDFRNDITIDKVVLPDISTEVSVLEAYCEKCESNSQIPMNMKSQIFPKSNLSRWNSIWWLRFRFWGNY